MDLSQNDIDRIADAILQDEKFASRIVGATIKRFDIVEIHDKVKRQIHSAVNSAISTRDLEATARKELRETIATAVANRKWIIISKLDLLIEGNFLSTSEIIRIFRSEVERSARDAVDIKIKGVITQSENLVREAIRKAFSNTSINIDFADIVASDSNPGNY